MKKDNLTLDDFLSRFQLLRPQVNRAALNQRQAAVLIPVVRREQPGLLLTQRSPHMRKHAGQVAFPGGAVDSTDASLIAAALREAHEEVAIPPEAVEVIGVLPPVDSVTGFRSRRSLALFRPIFSITPASMKCQPCLRCRLKRRSGSAVIIRWIFSVVGMIIGSGCPGISIILSGA